MQQQRTEEKWIFIYRWNNFTMDGEISVLFGNLRNWKKKKIPRFENLTNIPKNIDSKDTKIAKFKQFEICDDLEN